MNLDNMSEAEIEAANEMKAVLENCLIEKSKASFDAAVGALVPYIDKGDAANKAEIEVIKGLIGDGSNIGEETLALLTLIQSKLDGDNSTEGLQALEKLFTDTATALEKANGNASTIQSMQLAAALEKELREALQSQVSDHEARIKALEALDHHEKEDCGTCITKITTVIESACSDSHDVLADYFTLRSADLMNGTSTASAASTSAASSTTASSAETSTASEAATTEAADAVAEVETAETVEADATPVNTGEADTDGALGGR